MKQVQHQFNISTRTRQQWKHIYTYLYFRLNLKSQDLDYKSPPKHISLQPSLSCNFHPQSRFLCLRQSAFIGASTNILAKIGHFQDTSPPPTNYQNKVTIVNHFIELHPSSTQDVTSISSAEIWCLKATLPSPTIYSTILHQVGDIVQYIEVLVASQYIQGFVHREFQL